MFPDITCDDIFRIETRRLWLRWLRASDAPGIAAFAGLPAVARMTASIPHPYPPGEAERFVLNARAATAGGEALILALTLKSRARTLVGLVSAQARDTDRIEIGYVVAPNHAGRGYATEAVGALTDSTFNLTAARRLVADSRTDNPASRRVLEKSGFARTSTETKEMTARGGAYACDVFMLERQAWSERAGHRRLPAMATQIPPAASWESGAKQ